MKALSTLSIVLISVSAFADLKSDTKYAYLQVDKAFMSKDSKALEKATRSLVTSGFKSYQNGRALSYDEMIAEMKVAYGQFKKVTLSKATILSAKETGSRATSVTSRTLAGILVGADKKTHKVTMSVITDDRWVKVGNDWKLNSMTWTKQTMTLDGKPFNPGEPVKLTTPKTR